MARPRPREESRRFGDDATPPRGDAALADLGRGRQPPPAAGVPLLPPLHARLRPSAAGGRPAAGAARGPCRKRRERDAPDTGLGAFHLLARVCDWRQRNTAPPPRTMPTAPPPPPPPPNGAPPGSPGARRTGSPGARIHAVDVELVVTTEGSDSISLSALGVGVSSTRSSNSPPKSSTLAGLPAPADPYAPGALLPLCRAAEASKLPAASDRFFLEKFVTPLYEFLKREVNVKKEKPIYQRVMYDGTRLRHRAPHPTPPTPTPLILLQVRRRQRVLLARRGRQVDAAARNHADGRAARHLRRGQRVRRGAARVDGASRRRPVVEADLARPPPAEDVPRAHDVVGTRSTPFNGSSPSTRSNCTSASRSPSPGPHRSTRSPSRDCGGRPRRGWSPTLPARSLGSSAPLSSSRRTCAPPASEGACSSTRSAVSSRSGSASPTW